MGYHTIHAQRDPQLKNNQIQKEIRRQDNQHNQNIKLANILYKTLDNLEYEQTRNCRTDAQSRNGNWKVSG